MAEQHGATPIHFNYMATRVVLFFCPMLSNVVEFLCHLYYVKVLQFKTDKELLEIADLTHHTTSSPLFVTKFLDITPFIRVCSS